MNINLVQRSSVPSVSTVDRLPCWIMVLAADYATAGASSIPYGKQLLQKARQSRVANQHNVSGEKDVVSVYTLDLPTRQSSRVAFALLQEPFFGFRLLTLARRLTVVHRSLQMERFGILIQGFPAADAEYLAEAIISAVLAAQCEMPSCKSHVPVHCPLKTIHLYGLRARHRFATSFAVAEGNALARSLSILPGNILTPKAYLRRLRRLAREHAWSLQFYDERALKRKGAGAFLAVSQGSEKAGAGIVRLSYRPRFAWGWTGAPVALAGKGICYDTGGVNLKPARHMFGMHEDMQGSAVALGTLLALSRIGFPCPVDCWLALAENHIGPKAYKPNDVVYATNGTSIEIVHSDAEGRMVLADTLALATALKPTLIIDYATLTGSCIHALGRSYSGVFTNEKAWLPSLVDVGVDSGERVWPFPLDEDYDERLRSDIADIKQCAESGEADHILAARFLQHFVADGVPWIHLDLASSHHKGGLAHVPTDTTGFGVRYSVWLLTRSSVLQQDGHAIRYCGYYHMPTRSSVLQQDG